jgi:hypothetical protein
LRLILKQLLEFHRLFRVCFKYQYFLLEFDGLDQVFVNPIILKPLNKDLYSFNVHLINALQRKHIRKHFCPKYIGKVFYLCLFLLERPNIYIAELFVGEVGRVELRKDVFSYLDQEYPTFFLMLPHSIKFDCVSISACCAENENVLIFFYLVINLHLFHVFSQVLPEIFS